MKKGAQIVEYAAMFAILTFLHYTEFKLGIRAFALAYYFAAVYNRRNVIVSSPIFIASAIIVSPTVNSLIIAAAPVALVLILLFVLYRLRVKPRLAIMAAAVALAMLPRAFLETGDASGVITTVIGAVGTEITFFIFVSLQYLVFLKRFEFPLTAGESISIGVALFVVGLGMGYARVSYFSFYLPVAVYLLIMSRQAGVSAPLFAGAAMAIGVSVSWDSEAGVFTAIYAICVALCPRDYAYFGGVGGVALSALVMVVGGAEGLEYLGLVTPAVGVFAGILTPKKLRAYVHALSVTDSALTGARTVVNRNRKEIARKLEELGNSFKETGDILSDDGAGDVVLDCNEIAKEVSNRCCIGCPNEEQCKTSLRGNTTVEVIGELVASAMDTGKASILDASPYLSARCKKLKAIIASTNEIMSGREVGIARLRGADEFRELLRDQLLSLAAVLGDLSREAGEPVKYEGDEERKITEALNKRLIGVREIYVYDGGRVSLCVRDGENVIKRVGEVMNERAGRRMSLVDKEPTVNGLINLTYEPSPEYRVAYGERVLAAGDCGCGDRECVTRISADKVMIVLADGMGHDAPAGRNARYAVKLIESFYKAGFDHGTVLRSVGSLLSLRGREEFNAVDIAVIDTSAGTADIIKQGARESFIVRKGSVEVVECGSLPLGIVEEVKPLTSEVKLTTDAFLVMVSDGVIDTIGREGIIELLSALNTFNPDDVAEAVMSDFKRLVEDKEERDDASVIAARIF